MPPEIDQMPLPLDQIRGPEDLFSSPAFREAVSKAFPDDAPTFDDAPTRRRFLTLAGAGLALAGVGGCGFRPAPPEKIFAYVRQPEGMILGVGSYYATTMPLAGLGIGLLIKSREGRPIKAEGNPDHPASLGSTDVYAQGSIHCLYDPDRSKAVTHQGNASTWEEALTTLRGDLDKPGARIRILTEAISSPSLLARLNAILAKYPSAKWVPFEPAGRDTVRAGAKQAFAADVVPVYDFTKAKVVVTLDGDFGSVAGGVRYCRDFASRRRIIAVSKGKDEHGHEVYKDRPPAEMNRLYAVESLPTSTGSAADHRLPLRAADIQLFARALAARLGVDAGYDGGTLPELAKKWLDPLVEDLRANAGNSIVFVGETQPPVVHALAAAINAKLGNVGADKPVRYIESPEALPKEPGYGLKELVADINKNEVDVLLILGANPVYSAPADLDFVDALTRMTENKKPIFHLGQYVDETAIRCDWHMPEAHFLESWGDCRAFDGTASLIQPLIAPLYAGRSALEVVDSLTPLEGESVANQRPGREIVQSYWRKWFGDSKLEGDFEDWWQKALQRGVLPKEVTLATKEVAAPAGNYGSPPSRKPDEPKDIHELAFRIDPTVHDGRFANNGWLQELPKPVSKITWDNALFISPATAQARKIGLNSPAMIGGPGLGGTGGEHGQAVSDLVTVKVGDREITAAVYVMPGHADSAATLYLGYGREKAGAIGNPSGGQTGFNAYKLRSSDHPWIVTEGVAVSEPTGIYSLACTQMHHSMEGRKPVRKATSAEASRHPDFAQIPPQSPGEASLIRDNVPGSPGYNAKHGIHTPHHHHEHDHGDHDKRLVPLTMYADNSQILTATRRWGMVIDLTTCNGCNVCAIACMAENNIPVVGKEEVTKGREMHWIRIDRYYTLRGVSQLSRQAHDPGAPTEAEDPEIRKDGYTLADLPGLDKATAVEKGAIIDNPAEVDTYFMPVPCQQCEKAPCELVCPVAATVHSHDGLNDMVYNRCVGTRYCSNNCPYKVRRFNFLFFADYLTESFKLGRNPEVTVRSRGVMEKCTYCVQRIRAAEIDAERQYARKMAGRDAEKPRATTLGGTAKEHAGAYIRDGEVKTACQAACPAGAISFGDINDPESMVQHQKMSKYSYGLLEEINTMPRTSYLGAVRNLNPNPKMPKGA